MTSETDAEFLGRYWEELNWDTEDADFDRLFALARRGAAMTDAVSCQKELEHHDRRYNVAERLFGDE